MADLTRLPHQLDPNAPSCRAVIETPRGSRLKYDFDPKIGGFYLKALVPEGLTFPLDFGFIPSTRGEDGDPIDVLVLFEEALVVGAVIDVRLIGVIEADQTEDGKTVRNDRLLAVAKASRLYAHIATADDLNRAWRDNLEAFWVQYNALRGKRFVVRRFAGPQAAVDAIGAADTAR